MNNLKDNNGKTIKEGCKVLFINTTSVLSLENGTVTKITEKMVYITNDKTGSVRQMAKNKVEKMVSVLQ
jgi:hypothetical protein